MALYSERAMEKAMEQKEKALAAVRRMREKGEKAVGIAKTSAETVGTALAFGYARGRFTDPADEESFKVLGLEPDLLAGVAIHVLAFTGAMGDKYSEDLHAVANGALASFAVFKGVELGAEARLNAAGTQGIPPLSIGANPARGRSMAQQMADAGAGSSRAGA